jgi:transcriptional regulator with XRE-family HTH domain
MARAALGLSTVDLARKAEVGANTINRFEAGQDARISSLEKMRSALEAAGVIFVDENGAGPGVRLKKAESDPASKITSFLGAHRNNGYCDDCICEETGGTLAEVRKVTEPLRRSFGFLSGVDNCARCSERKLTTMAVTDPLP